MPKQPGGVSKTLRVQTLIEILNRHGILDKITITEKVALRLALDKNLIDRSIYRDLEELVTQNKIFVIYKDDYGNIINSANEMPAHFKSYWHTEKHNPNQIIGSGLIQSHDGDFICAKNLLTDVSITELNHISEVKKNSLIFNINHRFFSLNFKFDAYPFKLIITRKKPESDILDGLKSNFSIKLLILILPDPIFSSVKTDSSEFTYFVFEENKITLKNPKKLNFNFFYNKNLSDFDQFYFKKDKTQYANELNKNKSLSAELNSENIDINNFDLIQIKDRKSVV